VIATDLTPHQREVLLALTIEETSAKALAARLDSTPGALYKTLHDARRKLRVGLSTRPAEHKALSRAAVETMSEPTPGGAPLRCVPTAS
jgi:hypothetical protein